MVKTICEKARTAAFEIAALTDKQKNKILEVIAAAIEDSHQIILEANSIDLKAYNREDASFRDRLTLTDARITAMAEGVRQVALLKDPVGEVVQEWTAANGLHIKKVRAPLGVIAIIYEARPNVTVDVVSLCIKSGNAVVLKGGKDAINSNKCLYSIMKNALIENNFPSECIQLIEDVDRNATLELLKQGDTVDVVIPRGGDALKHFVLENATMPVIASAGGNCHLFIDKTADLKKALDIVLNAKLQRPSVCNALEQLIVHKDVAADFLPVLFNALNQNNCCVKGDKIAHDICGCEIANESEYKEEHQRLLLTVKVVDDVEEAIVRINNNGTKHSDGIVSNDQKSIDRFTKCVDSGCVYVNASTRFTDGFEFGFGAEIGISTQKLHARGPLGLQQLTSEKYICVGNGTVRK